MRRADAASSAASLAVTGRAFRTVVPCAIHLVGSLITVGFHVPRNERLADLDPTSAEAATVWAEYQVAWTALNHVRVVACLAAAGVWAVALTQRASP